MKVIVLSLLTIASGKLLLRGQDAPAKDDEGPAEQRAAKIDDFMDQLKKEGTFAEFQELVKTKLDANCGAAMDECQKEQKDKVSQVCEECYPKFLDVVEKSIDEKTPTDDQSSSLVRLDEQKVEDADEKQDDDAQDEQTDDTDADVALIQQDGDQDQAADDDSNMEELTAEEKADYERSKEEADATNFSEQEDANAEKYLGVDSFEDPADHGDYSDSHME
jgi:hypothetical protein